MYQLPYSAFRHTCIQPGRYLNFSSDWVDYLSLACTHLQGCGVESQGVGGVWVESESDFFVRLRLRKSIWLIFFITLLSWEFLLKWQISCETCWNREFLLCTTISIDCYLLQNSWQPNFIHFMLRNWSRESESEILERSELSRSRTFYLRLRNPAHLGFWKRIIQGDTKKTVIT